MVEAHRIHISEIHSKGLEFALNHLDNPIESIVYVLTLLGEKIMVFDLSICHE